MRSPPGSTRSSTGKRSRHPFSVGGAKQLLVYEGGNHSIALTIATTNGPEPRQYQAEWMAAWLEGRPFKSKRWFIEASGNVVKEALA